MSLRLVNGQGKTPTVRVEEAELELSVRLDDARAHVRRMRLALQTRFWSDPEFRTLAAPLLHEMDRYERQVAEEGKAA